MAGSEPSGSGPATMITAINVTPLVDITLVLLIVFMVTATYIVKAVIEVELPQAAAAGEDVGETLALVLKQADGPGRKADVACSVLALNGEVMDEATLVRALKAAASKAAPAKALLSADRDCRHSEFVHVVDMVKQAGIAKFAINIEKTSAGAP